ncbi:ATP-binding protein [Actinacidiphila yeochonensis]|uniref:ATP-binding protein n=1 Tax=Actinacidiphila yeochonensis TaxID=89050 RepID=UPI001E5E562C|nr:AAA family ATPase [Actinacidiphila yeochonensis]
MSRGDALLERDGPLAAADAALADLCGPLRGGGLLTVAAPAGLGKTTLLAEVRARAGERGCTVLSARGGDQEQQVAFHVARQLLQPLLAGSTDAELRDALGGWYGIVGPALGLCAAGGAAPDPQGLRDGLDWVLTHLVVQHAPVVLVLDDAHWADPQSLTWLSAFAPRADDLALLLVVAYRPDELPTSAAAFRGLPGRAGNRPIGLEPLTPEAVTSLVRGRLGAHADEEFCRECWTVTAGNPFEAVELTAKVGERGLRPERASAPLLRDLAAAVKGSGLVARLERMGPSTVRLAWAAAVLGTQVQPALAAAVAGLGSQEAADCADRLREARVLTGSRTLEFVHPLIATAIYRAIPDALRVALHGKAAWTVVDAGLGPAAAARHLMETHPEEDPWVVQQLRAAAQEMLRAGAPEAARDHLTRALREPPRPGERAAVLYELGCSTQLLEPATTVNYLQAALAEPIDDADLRDNINYRLSQSLAHSDRLSEAVDVVARAARGATTARARLWMQAEEFMWSAFRSDEPDSPSRSRRLARLADRLTGQDRIERYILGLRAWDAVVRGEPVDTALLYAGRALEGGLHWAAEDCGFEVPVLACLVYMYADRVERAEELFAQGIAEFERHGWRGAHLAFSHALLGYVRHRSGRLAEAEALARDGLRMAERVGRGTPVLWYAVTILTGVLIARGRTAEAVGLAAEYDFHAPFPAAVTFPDAQTGHGELLLAQGRVEEAIEELASVGRRLDQRGMRNPSWSPWQLHLAQAQRHTSPGLARETALDALDRAQRFGARSAVGQALRVAAEVARPEERLGLLDRAVASLEGSPPAHELAAALVAQGRALHAEGRRAEGAAALSRGLDLARSCGADGLAARAEAAVRADQGPADVAPVG